jgi:activator of HSP90 ATPase
LVKIKEVNKCEGEASANNRKAKLIFFYEWVITGEWEGSYKTGDNKTAYKGTFEITNLSEENEPSEVDVIVDIKDSKQHKLKEFMRLRGVACVREQLGKYIQLLKEEFSQGLILPTAKDTAASAGKSPANAAAAATSSSSPGTGKNQPNQSTGGKEAGSNGCLKIDTKKLTLNEEFKCRVTDLYQTFVDTNVTKCFSFCALTASPP